MNIAVILAGGTGSRSGLEKPKQFLKVAGKTIIEHTVDVFQKHDLIDEIAIVIHPYFVDDIEKMILKNSWYKVKKVLNGGKERHDSSLVAINAYQENQLDNIIFHDAVRPLVTPEIITNIIMKLEEYDAVDVAITSVDTIISVNKSLQEIDNIPNRKFMMMGQTPQAFKIKTIKNAYDIALNDPLFEASDDCGVVKKYLNGTSIGIVIGEKSNIKLTYIEDIYLLDKLFQIKNQKSDYKIKLSELKGKVIVVFGGNSGIGKAIIQVAGKYDVKCYCFSRSYNNVNICNITSVANALKSVHEKEGHIDYVINTAAILKREPLMHMDYDLVKQIIYTNYIGAVNVTIESFKYLKDSKGQILHFTSSSYTLGRAFYSLYSSSKAAIVNFTQAIAQEWEEFGIRVNCINPERTNTPMREKNFGIEDKFTLLKSEDVAIVSLKTLISNYTGQIIDVKIKIPKELES